MSPTRPCVSCEVVKAFVHVLDLTSFTAYTAVTPAKGSFLRLQRWIEVMSET
jgi:hypothetical protein